VDYSTTEDTEDTEVEAGFLETGKGQDYRMDRMRIEMILRMLSGRPCPIPCIPFNNFSFSFSLCPLYSLW